MKQAHHRIDSKAASATAELCTKSEKNSTSGGLLRTAARPGKRALRGADGDTAC
eukprot:CAMPEP_0115343858 /NCGR_PEP_ID=MMETSP0270-20121206/92958_1 /TAXON_ID=71861 /ORGANISM="Scrippsiella trochoidea, Strain CCMP3099" /LENGTH=53 /DNA_ID=CAMNT_0002765515 /DNA_START=176 /DNA_END=334 /DNA_ORIENTATION=+